MVTEITATEAARNLAEYLNRVAFRGERFIIRRGKKVVAELRPPVKLTTGEELAKAWSQMPHLSPQEAEEFARDVEASRAWLNSAVIENPWDR
jgi:antitoxin (DNA-binding transcriptional repressor) of toxin-antitoxin stability system